MAVPYNHKAIEAKWRVKWEEKPVNPKVDENGKEKEKYYCLDMFPYPSGNGLHVGHWRGYVISDVWSRYKLQQNYYVIHPMGWDAFGLPAENYAIKMGIHPEISTKQNVSNIKRQIQDIAAIYDWDMEVNTTDPNFYKWTQWIFVQMFKNGLAYEKEFPINWCPSCKTGLANELSSYWEANMELIDIIPEFNLYEEFWKIYTNSANIPPQYIADQGVVDRCIISNGSEIYGEVHSSVLGGSVTIGKGSVVRDSIIMQGVTIGENCVIEKAIIAEDTVVGDNAVIGIGSDVPNKFKPNIYSGGLATIGENSVIPAGVQIGKNTAVSGVTVPEDYPGGVLESGETLIKAGDRV